MIKYEVIKIIIDIKISFIILFSVENIMTLMNKIKEEYTKNGIAIRKVKGR